jgi:hypothetical protein
MTSTVSKSINYQNGKWYVKEVLPLEDVIKNLATNPTFRLETISSLPKMSFVAALAKNSESAYNTYGVIKVESQLLDQSDYWDTKIWVFAGSGNPESDALIWAVLSEESPDSQFIVDFGDIANILRICEQAARPVAMSKEYSKCIPEMLKSKIEILNIRQLHGEGQFQAPIILISVNFFDIGSIIDIEIDISNGTFLIKDTHRSLMGMGDETNQLFPKHKRILPLPIKWLGKREILMGANSNPNSIVSSLRISEFLGDNKQWSNPELISDALSELEKELLRLGTL